MKMFYRLTRRKFCSHSSSYYHHDFVLGKQPEFKPFNSLLMAAEFGRIIFYVVLGIKVITQGPTFLAFRRNKFVNNPDYRLCDAQSFEKISLTPKHK